MMKPDGEYRTYSKPILRSFSSLARTLARFRVYMNIVWVYYVSVSLARLKAYCLRENIFGVIYRYTRYSYNCYNLHRLPSAVKIYRRLLAFGFSLVIVYIKGNGSIAMSIILVLRSNWPFEFFNFKPFIIIFRLYFWNIYSLN